MKRSLEWMANAVGGHLVETDFASPEAHVDLSLVVTDSREAVQGATYIARVGENSDGHDFANSAISNGATTLIVERELPGLSVNQVVVQDSTVALGLLAKEHLAALREEGSIAVLGITGSAGKTTTKDLLGRVLSGFGPAIWPKLSYNNEVGCPMTILSADDTTRYLVLEMGASAVGELAYLTDIAPLDVGIVLMVGRAHLGGFGSVQRLARAKAELVEGIRKGGIAVLNADDPAVAGMSEFAPDSIVWFSAEGSPKADVLASDITFDEQGHPSFVVSDKQSEFPVNLGLVGTHQVSNALAAIGGARALGLDLGRVAGLISGLGAGSPHRMDVRTLQIPVEGRSVSVRLIDDSYNANPDSLKAAFKTARTLAGDGRLVMVLGEMMELGQDSAQIHGEVGKDALKVDPGVMVLIGGGDAYVQPGQSSDFESVSVSRVHDATEALSLLGSVVQSDDTILVKGSNGSGSWKVADGLVQLGGASGEAETA